MKNILFAASECVPLVKTGGLADVAGSLPKYFDREEFDVRVILPAYTMIPDVYRSKMQYLTHFYSYFNGRDRYVGVKKLEMDGLTFYFIDNEEYFGGSFPYTDYYYDIEKFCFFDKAVLSVLPSLGFKPDVIHCHDWHTGLIPVYLKEEFAADPFYQNIRTVMTVHNLKFQGFYNAEVMKSITGLPWELFTVDKLLSYDNGNMLKGGLVYADRISTVSRSYAEEVMTREYGECLEGLFRFRAKDFCGIVNGIDTKVFDPETDPALPARYSKENFRTGKKACKKALQQELGLTPDENVMLIGLISRLTEQKGLDLIAAILPEIMDLPVQFVVLGTGEARYEELFRKAAETWPGRFSASFRYSEELSHRIYAAADAFLMPSRFEPCGLSQLIALRYGTLPIVRATGGLKDTVEPYDPLSGSGTGFSFADYDACSLRDTVNVAYALYAEDRQRYDRLIRSAMSQDFSWDASARKYEALYRSITD